MAPHGRRRGTERRVSGSRPRPSSRLVPRPRREYVRPRPGDRSRLVPVRLALCDLVHPGGTRPRGCRLGRPDRRVRVPRGLRGGDAGFDDARTVRRAGGPGLDPRSTHVAGVTAAVRLVSLWLSVGVYQGDRPVSLSLSLSLDVRREESPPVAPGIDWASGDTARLSRGDTQLRRPGQVDTESPFQPGSCPVRTSKSDRHAGQ